MLRERLKTGTVDLHEAIESSPAMSGLLEPTLTRGQYIEFLKRMWQIHSHVEHAIEQVFAKDSILRERLPDSARRMKASSLAKDLQNFDESAGAVPSDLPLSIDTRAHVFGVMYVLEGSMLGGQVISKRLAQHEFITDQHLNYFRHYGPALGKMWQGFVQALDQFGQDFPEAQDEVLRAARQTFTALKDYRSENLKPQVHP